MNSTIFYFLLFNVNLKEAIRYINKTISSLNTGKRSTEVAATIDRLLVICNILTTICTAKGDWSLVDATISLQLSYYTYFCLILEYKQ